LLSPYEIAYAAHHVEMDILGLQCGIQDQLCAALGGINLIEMEEFPRATVTQLRIPDPLWWELDRRLVLFTIGQAHNSSAIHGEVIRGLQGAGPENEIFEALRSLAVRSRDALLASNLEALGSAMTENTETQRRLHQGLVSDEARSVIETAKTFGAAGWKVNGAGGGGGSLTILSGPGAYARRQMIREILQRHPFVRNIPVNLSRHGLRVWESPGIQ
jgi:D-glycero-alpha-D-manno-heptose-7-phosphate kinase